MVRHPLSVVLLLLGVAMALAGNVVRLRGGANNDHRRGLNTLAGDDDDLWPVGTRLYNEFDDGWYQGSIIDNEKGRYRIEWSDGSQDFNVFTDEEIDDMVGNYHALVVDGSWPVGTRVYYEFPDGWYEGTITDFDADGYTITWEDGTKDVDTFSDEEVDEMVEYYQIFILDDSWPIGTTVYYQFPDGWYEGTITEVDLDGYTITWSDNDTGYWTDDDEVDQMVEDYHVMVAVSNVATHEATEGMKPGAIVAIVALFVTVGFFGAWLLVIKRRNERKDVQDLERPSSLCFTGVEAWGDQSSHPHKAESTLPPAPRVLRCSYQSNQNESPFSV